MKEVRHLKVSFRRHTFPGDARDGIKSDEGRANKNPETTTPGLLKEGKLRINPETAPGTCGRTGTTRNDSSFLWILSGRKERVVWALGKPACHKVVCPRRSSIRGEDTSPTCDSGGKQHGEWQLLVISSHK
ncbi:unnamed protein product, partial [Iphiclides podalirius]